MLYLYRKENDPGFPDKTVKNVKKAFGGSASVTEKLRDYIGYEKIKKLLSEKDAVMIVSLSSISHNKAEALTELQWFLQNNITLMITEYPTTINADKAGNTLSLRMLADVYKSLQDNKTFDIRAAAGRHNSGRKKTAYPEGWEALYKQWDNGKITAVEFMKKTGLKRGTFYHLASDYRTFLAGNELENCSSI
jgi:DNA invertase Pin-like site-specific DNA recombinase